MEAAKAYNASHAATQDAETLLMDAMRAAGIDPETGPSSMYFPVEGLRVCLTGCGAAVQRETARVVSQ